MAVGEVKTLKDLWVVDTGASANMCNSIDGLSNVRDANQTIQVGNEEQMKS